MAINDEAVLVAAQGFVYVNSVGAASPTPDDVLNFAAETFGAQKTVLTVTGTPTGGNLTLTVAGTAVTIPWNASASAIQQLVEAADTVGVGNTVVTGTSLATGISIWFVEQLQSKTLVVSTSGSGLTGGSTPASAVVTTAPNGWNNIGHTSRGKMPEFGFDGGKLSMRGSWQKERLREVRASDPMEDSLKVVLEQWDADSLELYFGEDVANTPGIFGVSGLFNPVEKSIFVAIVDGTGDAGLTVGFYSPKAQIQRDGSVDLPLDDFAGMPIEATFLNLGARRLYDWISPTLFPASS